MTTDPFGAMPVWLPDQLDERIEALLDRIEAALAGPTTAKMPDPSRVRIAKLLLRNSKCDTQRYFEAEKVLLQERAASLSRSCARQLPVPAWAKRPRRVGCGSQALLEQGLGARSRCRGLL